MPSETEIKKEILGLTADIVAAYVSNNSIRAAELPDMISQIYGQLSTLSVLGIDNEVITEPLVPAISIRKSVSDNEVTCLECGKRFKSLKRHLMSNHNLSPEDYRAKWELPATYPMVAPAYSVTRSKLAKTIGLGRKTSHAGVVTLT